MLIKLMKHEFRATGRIMLPLYLILLVASVGANLTTRGLMNTPYRLLDVLGTILVLAFVFAILGVCLVSFILMIQRFYKNLLQDEGYLMMTLPVSVHQQIWAKAIVSTVWFALTVIMVILACCIVVYEVGMFSHLLAAIWHDLIRIPAYYAANGVGLLLELFLLCCAGSVAMCLEFYAALAVGHSRPRHKMAWSVGVFFLFQFASQMLFGALVVFVDSTRLDAAITMALSGLHGMAAGHAFFLLMILITAVYGAVFYVITAYFLKNKLNLE